MSQEENPTEEMRTPSFVLSVNLYSQDQDIFIMPFRKSINLKIRFFFLITKLLFWYKEYRSDKYNSVSGLI